jgi:lipid-binding SYLF domain-containing protein
VSAGVTGRQDIRAMSTTAFHIPQVQQFLRIAAGLFAGALLDEVLYGNPPMHHFTRQD